jgi:hypothetical protein
MNWIKLSLSTEAKIQNENADLKLQSKTTKPSFHYFNYLGLVSLVVILFLQKKQKIKFMQSSRCRQSK